MYNLRYQINKKKYIKLIVLAFVELELVNGSAKIQVCFCRHKKKKERQQHSHSDNNYINTLLSVYIYPKLGLLQISKRLGEIDANGQHHFGFQEDEASPAGPPNITARTHTHTNPIHFTYTWTCLLLYSNIEFLWWFHRKIYGIHVNSIDFHRENQKIVILRYKHMIWGKCGK